MIIHSLSSDDFYQIFWLMGAAQRLDILLKISNTKSKPTQLSEVLDATRQEIARNIDHLRKANLIKKDTDGFYHLTTLGKVVCDQIPSLIFVSENKEYFKDHDFVGLPNTFKQSLASLKSGKLINGFVKVESKWKQIIENAQEYVKNILIEVPTSEDLLKTIVKQANQNVTFYSIFSESPIIPLEERTRLVKKFKIPKLVQENSIQQRMAKDPKIIVHLNEKEACVMFPNIDGNSDFSKMFYSKDPDFHEWCLLYFEYCWNVSKPFQENKIKNNLDD